MEHNKVKIISYKRKELNKRKWYYETKLGAKDLPPTGSDPHSILPVLEVGSIVAFCFNGASEDTFATVGNAYNSGRVSVKFFSFFISL